MLNDELLTHATLSPKPDDVDDEDVVDDDDDDAEVALGLLPRSERIAAPPWCGMRAESRSHASTDKSRARVTRTTLRATAGLLFADAGDDARTLATDSMLSLSSTLSLPLRTLTSNFDAPAAGSMAWITTLPARTLSLTRLLLQDAALASSERTFASRFGVTAARLPPSVISTVVVPLPAELLDAEPP